MSAPSPARRTRSAARAADVQAQIKLRSASAVFPDEVNLQIYQKAFELDRQDYAAARVGYDKQVVALFRTFFRQLSGMTALQVPPLSDSWICRDPKAALQTCLDIQVMPDHTKRVAAFQRDLVEDLETLLLAAPARWSRLARLRLVNQSFNRIAEGFMWRTLLLPARKKPSLALRRMTQIW